MSKKPNVQSPDGDNFPEQIREIPNAATLPTAFTQSTNNEDPSSKWRIFTKWILASTVAVPIGVFIGSLITGTVAEFIYRALSESEETEFLMFWCFQPILFLITFWILVVVIQRSILKQDYQTGVWIFVGSLLGALIANAIISMSYFWGIWLAAALGLAWWNIEPIWRWPNSECDAFPWRELQALLITVVTGGVSGAITGMIVNMKSAKPASLKPERNRNDSASEDNTGRP